MCPELYYRTEVKSSKRWTFFFWKSFELVEHKIREHPTVAEMLSYVCNYREEKSVKRACFKAYQKEMLQQCYDPKADYIFTRMIDDPNHLVKLIAMEPKVKKALFANLDVVEVYGFFDFLKAYYTERDIVKFWTTLTLTQIEENLVVDTIQMSKEIPERYFKKTKADFEHLHEALIRCNSEMTNDIMALFGLNDNRVFVYPDHAQYAQLEANALSFRLPLNSVELFKWAKQLRNCMYGYAEKIFLNKTIIYGVFLKDELTYAVEISKNKIIQASAVSNTPIGKEDMQRIEAWFRTTYLKESYIL